MESQAQGGKLRRLVWIGSFVALITIFIAIAASWMLYGQTLTLLTENLRERLQTISVTEAANIDAKDLEALKVEEDWQKPEWSRIVSSLHRAKYNNKNVVFMYIFRKTKTDPTQMEFVGDADSLNPYANTDADPENNVDVNGDGKIESDGPDKLQWPGQPYPEAVDIPETYTAYDGPLTVKDLYTDAYGTVLTGYAPIKDQNGNTVAVLGTDIKADDFFTVTRQTLYPFLIFIAFLIIIISVLATILIFLWERQAKAFEELDQLKSEFLSIASHQLRAPITAIRGYISLILDGDYGIPQEQMKEPLRRVGESARDMANSIEDYLNVSRIEQDRMKYEKRDFNVVEIAQKAIDEIIFAASRKGLTLTLTPFGEPLTVNADVDKIKQVILNLIDNAIKYTEKGGVTVTLKKEAGKARIIISDTGIGIAQNEIGGLFEKFKRARNAKNVNISGTGLGLYVAKQLIEGHNGSIHVESEGAGKGATFIVEFPA